MTAYFPKNKKILHLFKAWSISPSPKVFSAIGADNRNLSFISIPLFYSCSSGDHAAAVPFRFVRTLNGVVYRKTKTDLH